MDQDKVNAVLGSWGSSLSMAAGPIVKDKKVPAIALSATNPLVTKGNDYYFRVCFIDPFQGTVMANYAFKELKAKKAVIIREVSNDYSVGPGPVLHRQLQEAHRRRGRHPGRAELQHQRPGLHRPAHHRQVDEAGRDLRAGQLHRERARHQAGARARHHRAVPRRRHLGDPEFIDVGKQAVEGAVFSTFFATEVPITETSKTFLDAYRKQYGKEPAAVTALGFDGYLVARAAIEKAGSLDGAEDPRRARRRPRTSPARPASSRSTRTATPPRARSSRS